MSAALVQITTCNVDSAAAFRMKIYSGEVVK